MTRRLLGCAIVLLTLLANLADGEARKGARGRRDGARGRARTSAEAAGPARETWREGDRSVPLREKQWIRQRFDGVKIDRAALVNVRELVAGADRIVAIRGRKDDERWLVSREVAAALKVLRAEVKREFGPEYDLWLNGAYDSGGRLRKRQSMHARGCAVDLDLYKVGRDGARGHKENGRIGELAPIVARVWTTRVDDQGRPLRGWVLHEGNHVHASLESPSMGGVFVEPPPPKPGRGSRPVAMRAGERNAR